MPYFYAKILFGPYMLFLVHTELVQRSFQKPPKTGQDIICRCLKGTLQVCFISHSIYFDSLIISKHKINCCVHVFFPDMIFLETNLTIFSENYGSLSVKFPPKTNRFLCRWKVMNLKWCVFVRFFDRHSAEPSCSTASGKARWCSKTGRIAGKHAVISSGADEVCPG